MNTDQHNRRIYCLSYPLHQLCRAKSRNYLSSWN